MVDQDHPSTSLPRKLTSTRGWGRTVEAYRWRGAVLGRTPEEWRACDSHGVGKDEDHVSGSGGG
jgi:hypothetical protein